MLEITAFAMNVEKNGLIEMAYWKKGKTFRKGNRLVRYIYKNGSKRNKKLVSAGKSKRSYRRRY